MIIHKKPETEQKNGIPEIEIPRLINEMQTINGQEYKNLQDTMTNVFNSLQKGNATLSIQKTPELKEGDLIALSQGFRKIFSFYPRPIQLMAVYLLYNHSDSQGRLAQIYTGEGKTYIVALLAVLIAIKKDTVVDIITSSPVLAKRDAEELVKFYGHFKLKVSHNVDEKQQQDQNGMLVCYKANIVYGDSHSFEGDILRHEYSEQGTKGDRKQGYAIVDEVDSMLIDGIGHQTFLSSPIPGMLDITKILILIWEEICKIEQNLTPDRKVTIVNDNEIYNVDLQEYISRTIDFQIKEAVGKLMLPYRLDYINFMKENWIKNAIHAKFVLQKDKNYVIDQGQVRIVDFQNTGVIHTENMQWQEGIHQFVQLKHKLNVTSLVISTNFMSNVCFFKRYKNKILGLTGTLGSEYTKQLLSKQYNVDFVLIPPNKPRLLKESPGKAMISENEWLEEIKQDVLEQINKNRAVLIINETIQDVKSIEAQFMANNIKVTLYTDDSQEIDKKINEKDVIIATNLAGRGTDLTTNDVIEQNGGLHVIVTFLPRNIRIQEQAFGRTARQGKNGTARLIILKKMSQQDKLLFCSMNWQFKNQELYLLDILKQNRDQNEKFIMEESDQEMNRLMYEDECFQTFCKVAKSQVNMKQERSRFKSLEEKWGLYLEQHKKTGLDKDEIVQIIGQDTNPKYLIMQGLENNKEELIEQASSITQEDPAVVYYQGCFQLKKLSQEDIQIGLQTLQKAKQLFQNKINDEKGYHLAVQVNRKLISEFQQAKEPSENQNEQMFGPLFENIEENKKASQNQKIENVSFYQEKIQNQNNFPSTVPYSIQQQSLDESFNIGLQKDGKKSNNIKLENLEKQQVDQINFQDQSFNIQNRFDLKIQQKNNIDHQQLNQTFSNKSNQQISQNYQQLSWMNKNCSNNLQYQNSLPNQQQQLSNNQPKQFQQQNNQSYRNVQQQQWMNKNELEKEQINQENIQKAEEEVNSKIENQIKVYQKFINNIDEIIQTAKTLDSKNEELDFGWISTLQQFKKEKLENKQKQEFKDKVEVIEDGPLPKMGKLYKKKKEKSFSWIALFLIGVLQFVAGCVICACTAGAAYGIGSYFIKEGISDMALAITSVVKGIEIDWGQWGQKKVTTFCATLALAGPAAIKEAFTILGKSFKTIQKVGILGILKTNIKNIGLQSLRNAGQWLSQMEQNHLQNQYDTIRLIAQSTDQSNSKQEILFIAQEILREQVQNQLISVATSQEIETLVRQSIVQSQGTNETFQSIVWKLCQRFLSIQMAKFKSNQDQINQKQNLQEVCNRNGSMELQQIKTQMQHYKQSESKIRTDLSNFRNLMIDSLNKDQEIQSKLLGLDVFFEKMCDKQKFKQHFTSAKLQQHFEFQYQELQQNISDSEFLNLDINNHYQINQFYNKYIRQKLYKFVEEFSNKYEEAQEPLAIILFFELKKQYEQAAHNLEQDIYNFKQQQQNVESEIDLVKSQYSPSQYQINNINNMIENLNNSRKQLQQRIESFQAAKDYLNIQTCISLIKNCRQKSLIYSDGITCSQQFIFEFNKGLQTFYYSYFIQQLYKSAISNALQISKTIRCYLQKLFTNPLVDAYESEVVKRIEHLIFDRKMQILDKSISANLKFLKN